ncbi:chitinase [Burkholderia ubonensis]|uniref:glycosyl hydrolase family 18 protein n=1 Tax=Burkholderia ubonensis TaxID=101571 RepID=UPI00075D87F4|nr:glycosyl hydrolase family 18 protein [Burkholderia ubonensis]KVD51419.1 chitinase [Burkholderia ubonensis]
MQRSIHRLCLPLIGASSLIVASSAAYALPSCSAWQSSQIYNAGDYALYNGQTWQAQWWTRGETPTASQGGVWQQRAANSCAPISGGGSGSGVPPEPTPTVGYNVGSYFTQWGIYQRQYFVKNLMASGGDKKLTVLNYAFGNVYANGQCGMVTVAENGNGDGGDAWADYQRTVSAAESVDGQADSWDTPLRGNFNQLRKLKLKNPQLKVLIALGGWTWSKNFSTAAASDASRQALVSSCIDLYIKGNLPQQENAGGQGVALGVFDGFDIDWEYPVAGGLPTNHYSAADKQNFTLLLAEFRRQLDALGQQNKRRYYLSAALGAGVDKIRNTEPSNYGAYLDWANVMSYDFHGGWEAQGPTNFHSNLYPDPANPAQNDAKFYDIDDAVNALVSAGLARNRINVGIPFYGRGWTGVTAGPNGNGLYQSATGPAPGTYEAGYEDYRVLAGRAGSRYVHPVTKQLWSYDGTQFWSYDTPDVIRTKLAYVKAQQLGGVFSWSLDGDDMQGSLLSTMGELRSATAATKPTGVTPNR